jgi:hypothetical protein
VAEDGEAVQPEARGNGNGDDAIHEVDLFLGKKYPPAWRIETGCR